MRAVTRHLINYPSNLEKSVERGFITQDISFTVLSKNFSFTHKVKWTFFGCAGNQEFVLETVGN